MLTPSQVDGLVEPGARPSLSLPLAHDPLLHEVEAPFRALQVWALVRRQDEEMLAGGREEVAHNWEEAPVAEVEGVAAHREGVGRAAVVEDGPAGDGLKVPRLGSLAGPFAVRLERERVGPVDVPYRARFLCSPRLPAATAHSLQIHPR